MKENKEIARVFESEPRSGAGFSLWRGLRRAFGFFTILPVSGESLEEAASASWLLPAVAAVLGTVEGLAAWGLSFIFGPLLTAAVVLALALILTGFHHADGLADTGDAIMARGSAARRLEVLRDRTLGVGAVGALLLTYLVSWSALTEAATVLTGSKMLVALIAVEVSARLSMILTALITSPSHKGSGSAFMEALSGRLGAAGIALSLAVFLAAAPLIPWASLFTAAAAVATAAAVSFTAGRWFGGAGGDILGASIELGRMAALVALVASLAMT